MKLIIIIPTYNEIENISKLVIEILTKGMDDLGVLIVDDDSPDGTGKEADLLSQKYKDQVSVIHRKGKLGLGTAYIEGFNYSIERGADAIGQMDADFSHPVDKLAKMLDALKDFDIVIGSRYVKGGRLDDDWPIWRKGLSSFGNIYARTILDLPVKDVTGGFKIWRRSTLENMPLHRVRSNGYAFQVEMNFIAHRLGNSFIELPIYFADRRWGESKMSLRITIEAAIRVLQMRLEYKDLIQKN